MVVIAFSIVYLVWGSTYFFIKVAIQEIPPMIMAGIRFSAAGLLLMTWCVITGEKIFNRKNIFRATISGLMLLLVGNGAVVLAEKYLSSSLVAVIASTSPFWVVLLDSRNYKTNFSNRNTIAGLIIGFVGVVLLFSESAIHALSTTGNRWEIISLAILVIAAIAWGGGSLFVKYYSTGESQSVNASWQMLSAGIAFIPVSIVSGEWKNFHWQEVGSNSWFALLYLIVFGSLIAYSAYTWLLKVRPAVQVSTHGYVNPVVAVLLGTMLANEKMTVMQIAGLIFILLSVLLLNMAKYRSQSKQPVIKVQKTHKERILSEA
ncbi:MAG: EamA family transporter [Bacteroidetes bacterium]|nr:EamA family transporter [Bacteroidota bacterium]